MQFMMKLFEVNPQGFGGPSNMQKVAVKMPTDGQLSSTDGDTQFAEIMAALFSMPAEQLEASLANLEKIKMGEASTELVPVIDLAKLVADEAGKAGMGDLKAEVEIEAESSAANGDLGKADLSKLFAGLMEREHSAKAVPFKSEVATRERSGMDSATHIHRIGIERIMAQPVQKEVGPDIVSKAVENTTATESGAALKHQFQAGKVADKTVTDNTAPVDVKAPANKVFQKIQVVEGESTEDVDNEPPSGNGARFGAAVRTRSNTGAGMANQKASHTEFASEQGSKGSILTAQEKMDEKPILDDVGLKQRIKSEEPMSKEPREKVVSFTNVGQSTSNTATNTASTENQQTINTPTAELSNSKMTVQPKQESAEVSTTSKEMETDIVRQIVQRMSLRTDGRQSHMQIRLKPEFLGNLKMDVITENTMVMVRMTAESQSVKEMIEQNIGLLKTELQQQGLQVQKVDVTVSQDNDHLPGGDQQAAFEQTRQGRGRRRENRSKNEGASGDAEARGELGEVTSGTQSSSEVDFFA